MILTHIDLFSGIGGFALAAQWAGFKTVCFVEIEPYAQEIIKERFGAVADTGRRSSEYRGEARDVVSESGRTQGETQQRQRGGDATRDCRPTLCGDIFTFDGTPYRGATLLTGGFPCQPFSQAGKRRGKEDDRYLWPEMLRVIREARPAWVLAENVDGLTSMVEFDSLLEVDTRHYTREEMASGSFAVGEVRERGDGRGILHEILEDLAAAGYAVQTFVIPACAVDAKHRRDRVWIVGHAMRTGPSPEWDGGRQQDGFGQSGQDVGHAEDGRIRRGETSGSSGQPAQPGQDVADANVIAGNGRVSQSDQRAMAGSDGAGWCEWLPEPDVGRVAHGIPARVDRLKGLGNSIVPQVAYEIIKVIAEIETTATA